MKTLIYNAKIWQWNKESFAKWMIIEDSKIVELGYTEVNADAKLDECINFNGELILPGLIDAHIHVLFTGEVSHYIDLNGCKSIEEFQIRVKLHAEKYPTKEWIVGFGWEQDLLSRYPIANDIDVFVNDRPVLLWRVCWHIAVVNTKALTIAGINTSLEIKGGIIDIDQEGVPTGILREEATSIIQKYVGETSNKIRKEYLVIGLNSCLKAGLTSVQTNDHGAWNLYEELQQEQKLPIRVFLTPDYDELGNIPLPNTCKGLLSCHRLKLFADGSLGAETAALRKPYKNTNNKGLLIQSDRDLFFKLQKAHDHGYRVEIHAIGDRAAQQVLDAIEKSTIEPKDRPILTHCQVLGKDLISKMNQCGVIANIQPSFTITDAGWVLKRLQDDVIQYSYCWKTLIDSNVVCAGGSDSPVETVNPFQGMYDAMYRAPPGQSCNFLPHEKLTFEEALQIYTKNAAYAAGQENKLGSLSVGYFADFIVLPLDVVHDPNLLLKVKPSQVWVNGVRRTPLDTNIEETNISGLYAEGKNGRIRVCTCCRPFQFLPRE